MMMFLSLPRWVYALLAVIVILVGTYLRGHHNGWAERDAEMQLEIARKNSQARETEQKLNDQINTHATKLQEANNAITEKQTALDRAIRAGRLRISTPASCVPASPGAPAPAGDLQEARGQPNGQVYEVTDAERQTLAAIAEIIAQGDRNTAQLNACIDAYNAVMQQVNAQGR